MGELERDYAFDIREIQTLRTVGTRVLQIAEETGKRQENCMLRLQTIIDGLPSQVNTRKIEETIRRLRGTMTPDEYISTRETLERTTLKLIEAIPRIDREMTAEIEQLSLRAKKIEMQIKSIELLIGEDCPSVTVAEFQRRLKQDTGIWEREEVCRYMELSDGRFQYNWAEIIKTLTGETLTEREQEAMLEVLSSMGREEKRRKKALTETLLKQCEGVEGGREVATKNLKQISEKYQEYIETADAGEFSAFFNRFLIDMDPDINGLSHNKCETWTVKTGTNFYDLNWWLKGDLKEGGEVKVIIPKKTAINSEGEECVQFLYNGVVCWVPECDLNEADGSGQPVQITNWLTGYTVPSKSGGRDVYAADLPSIFKDWYAYEKMTGIGKWTLIEYPNLIAKQGPNKELIDENGYYWIAAGPRIINEQYDDNGNLTVSKNHDNKNILVMGKFADVVLEHISSGDKVYIYCRIGDIKAHTWISKGDSQNGLSQTGVPYPNNASGEASDLSSADGSTVEFMGHPTYKTNGDPDNGDMSKYRLVKIIVHD